MKQLIKKILYFLKQILPNSLYALFYNVMFGLYKATLRTYYYRHIIYYTIKADKKNLQKAQTIYKVMPYSLVGAAGLAHTYDAVTQIYANNVSGCIIECGVAKGGSAALMALRAAQYKDDRKIWLFDSFEGLPEPTEHDFKNGEKITGEHIRPLVKGSCLGTFEEVEDLLFDKLKLKKQNIFMIKGWFQDTLALNKNKIDAIALLRIDADWYESVKCCLENLYENVSSQGIIIIDDYDTCFGAKQAVDEFLQKINIKVELVPDGRGGRKFTKP